MNYSPKIINKFENDLGAIFEILAIYLKIPVPPFCFEAPFTRWRPSCSLTSRFQTFKKSTSPVPIQKLFSHFSLSFLRIYAGKI